MAAGNVIIYDSFKEYMGDGTIDLDGDTFKVLLTTSSYSPSISAHSTVSDITNELSGSGYAQYSLTQTWTKSGSTTTFDADDAAFTASGGSITARYAVIYDDTPSSPADPLVGYVLLDTTPADVSVADGNTLTVSWNVSGIFDVSGAAS